MKPVQFHPAAREEVNEAAAHYEAKRDGLGREFRFELAESLGRMARNPQMYAMELGEFRACPLRRFPSTIFYIDLDDRLWVGAVAHQHRRPGYWARRRPQ